MMPFLVLLLLILTPHRGALPSAATLSESDFAAVSRLSPQSKTAFTEPQTAVSVTFSAPLDPATVSTSSFIVVRGEWHWAQFGSSKAIEKAIRNKVLTPLDGTLSADARALTWTWTPALPYQSTQ